MNVEADNAEEKAVHSWSRISSAGQKALEEALRVFNPMSRDLSDTETQLVAFIQGLREEGYQPTILRSKDVYGYSSCTARMPGQAKTASKTAASISESAKAPARSTAVVAKVPGPLAGITISSPKDSKKPLPKSSNSTNLLLNSLKRTRSGTSNASMGFPAHLYPGVYPAMRLSVVLEALVPLKGTASCLESKCEQGHLGISPSDLKLLKAAGASRQPPAIKATKMTPGQLDAKGYRNLVKKGPDSGTLAVSLVKGPKGGVLQESNACKASGVLNGRLSGSASQSCSTGTSRTKEPPAAKTERRGSSSSPQETAEQKRKRAVEGKELPHRKKPNPVVSPPSKPDLASATLNLLKFRAIKVNSSSDDELRRRAQKILRVNLSPVIRIQPLPHSRSVP
ncbi:coiled-coil domain-containing protein 71 [Zootoca vivipara]|uniref:coiled-coil domain-containing protein 71 n=1 Tax=Zootoca vivipara TaxID=8524 RepID=UPI00293BCF1D|nr:coiled-coil domain-containing protein 71 [Zootoca vivipara]